VIRVNGWEVILSQLERLLICDYKSFGRRRQAVQNRHLHV